MRYYPKRHSPEKLLILAGFTHSGPGVGWEKRNVPEARVGFYDRLHASTHYGHINMHFDTATGPKTHKASGTHKAVKRELEALVFLDRDWRDDVVTFTKRLLGYGTETR